MKIAPLIVLASALTAPAAVFTYNFGDINAPIPNFNPSGISNTQSVGDLGIITEIMVTLNIADGSNGDLYVYLAHNDKISILLNRPGRTGSTPDGYSDPGIQMTFADNGAFGDIHTYRQAIFGNDDTALGGPLTEEIAGPFEPDGRAVSPFTVTTDSARTAKLAVFNGQQLSGDWTLFVADLGSGGFGTLAGWTMQVTTVPEPFSATAAALTLLGFGAYRLLRR